MTVFGDAGDEQQPQAPVPEFQHSKENIHFLSNAFEQRGIVRTFSQWRIVLVNKNDERLFLKITKQIGDVQGGGLIVATDQVVVG